MQISIDCRYIRERPSGIGSYTQALIDRLPGLAPEIRYKLWVAPQAQRPLTCHPNVSEQRVSAPANSLRSLLVPTRLFDLRDVDVLHAPFNILGRGIPCPVVVTIHDLMWLEAPWLCEGLDLATPFSYFFYNNGIRRAIREARIIVAISRATADCIGRLFPRARPKVRVIYHGTAPHFRPPADRDEAARSGQRLLGIEGPYLLVVGQNAPSKNHAAILEAFAAARLPSRCHLVLIQRLYQRGRWGLSRGPQLDALARKLGIAPRVIWKQSVDEAQLLTLLQGAAALVQFSRYEGFGLPVVEAMTCGTPVVVSNIPTFIEIVGDAGLHAPLSVPGLAKQLQRVVNDEVLRAELSEKGICRSRIFSWDISAAQHLEAYQEAGI